MANKKSDKKSDKIEKKGVVLGTTGDDEDEEEEEDEGTLRVESPEEEGDADGGAPAESEIIAGVGEVSAKKLDPKLTEKPDDLVTMALRRDVDCAPVIGKFSFADYGITELKANKNYKVPRYVRDVLIDKGLALKAD